MKLSVIVPIYNVEKYLPRCLDSLLRQGLEAGEYEIICVNDGSPDNCATILADYQQKHPDIFRVITQENRGLGEARNSGLEVAQGKWITFLDSDDYIIDGGYKYILDHFCEERVDVIHFNWLQVYTDGKMLHDPEAKPYGEIIFDGDVAVVYNHQKLPYTWTKFYYRPLLEMHRIRFEAAFMEDEPFNFDVFLWHPRVRCVTSNIYRYEQGNVNSLLSTVDKESVKKQLKWLMYMIEKMNKYLKDGDGDLEPAAVRNLNMFSVHYYNKMLKASFTWHEWRQYSWPIRLKRVHQLEVSEGSSILGKAIAFLKNGSGRFYGVYILTAFFLNIVFTRWIRPRIIASNSYE